MLENKKQHCPVCDMKAVADVPAEDYHKMLFHFCSEQCRETFLAHPQLYSGKETREIIKHRRLRLERPLDHDLAEAVMEYLQILMGARESHVQDQKLEIRYDLLQLNLIQIERALSEVDVQLDNRWWHRLQRNYLHTIESNELKTLAAPPSSCCNFPPPRA